MEYYADEGEATELVSSFQTYAAEGDGLAKLGEFRKAIEAYTKVIYRSLVAIVAFPSVYAHLTQH